jgi:signal transduction histidine kinase
MKNGKSRIKFLQDNKQVFYSIALMIIIPCAVVLNTYLLSQSFKSTVDQSLQERAVTIGQAVNTALVDKLNAPEQIQSFVDEWKTNNTDTKVFDIFYRENGDYKLIASSDKEAINQNDQTKKNITLFEFSWVRNYPIAQKVMENNIQYWWVVMPLSNAQGEEQALLSMRLSADFIDSSLSAALMQSFWVLIGTIVIIVLLLFTNSRIFEYSVLYNKIKEIDEMKDEFISMASHELRTPITVIKGYASMILEEAQGLTDQVKADLSIISVSADRLAALIEDMLNVSRIEQGRLKIDLKITDAGAIIGETVEELKIQADEKKLALNYLVEGNIKTNVNIDKDKFKQVLINIIGNAIKYTLSGSVEVRALNRDKNLVVLVKDTGIGMTAKEREHLFEKFYRVKNEKTQEIVGTGLGLWITKQIVELMNGTISVDSMESVGTQITIELPLIEEKK